ncbi:hypothetical protein CPB84DRAFT_1788998 [Gymnopilus junonius]|uniref:Uncharacterized protein n=1 Tax=Gymnopilus junonius TaxID=109634 RepID=A0A9P5NH09_GYMJU|nr:hypothetical protein CPB84DRAFT_1788998 [Gymnopilus junonius]
MVLLNQSPRELSEEVQILFLRACIALSMIGFIGCSLLLGTAILSNSVHRHLTWFSFIFSWIVSCVSYLLLLFSNQLESLDPPFGVCLTQATLIYSAPPLTAASTLSLIAQVYFNIRGMISHELRRNENIRSMILILVPYFLHAGVTIGALIIGLKDPATVQREDLDTPYCNMKNRIPSKIASISVVILIIPTLCIEAVILLNLRRHWTVFKSQKLSLSTALRVTVFSFFGVIAVVVSVLFASTKDRSPELNVIISSMSLVAFLIFSSQADILSVWMFWRRKSLQSPTDELEDSSNELRGHLHLRTDSIES